MTKKPFDELTGRAKMRAQARALRIGRDTLADRMDGEREVQEHRDNPLWFLPQSIQNRKRSRFITSTDPGYSGRHLGPRPGIQPLVDAPRIGGIWLFRDSPGGVGMPLELRVFGDHQRGEMEFLHSRGAVFYPETPIQIPEKIMSQVHDLQKKSKLPAKQAGLGTVNAFFQQHKSAIAAVLPRHITADRLLKISLGAVRDSHQLAECTVESLFGAVIKCAELGLEPNTPLQLVHMIPFNVRRGDSWQKEIQVIIGYRGYIDLARRSGQIAKITAHEVRERDVFEYEYGLDEKLVHKPALGDERGNVIAYYAAARLVDGTSQFEIMTPSQVDAIRDKSQGWQQAMKNAQRDKAGNIKDCASPWWNHAVEMGRKTVVRRLMKYLPLSIELAHAQRLDDALDETGGQHLGEILQGEYRVEADFDEVEKTGQPANIPAHLVDAEGGDK